MQTSDAAKKRPAGVDDRPFIVCTLQRTGGTNLTHHLSRLSPFRMMQHEPFNQPRVHGYITRAWKQTQDPAALESALAEVVAQRENIKHCIEMVPWKVTELLLKTSAEAGFRHLFLYRRDTMGRILSMEYAQRTKVWGPSHVEKAAGDAAAFEVPLDIEKLTAHETRCVQLTNKAWRQLRAAGAKPVALAYEEIYGAHEAPAQAALTRVLTHLGLSRGAAQDAALLAELRAKGDQNTRDRYARFQGIEGLHDRLTALPPLVFAGVSA